MQRSSILFLLFLSVASSAAALTYPKNRTEALAGSITLTVGGVPVPVIDAPGNPPAAYARFEISGTNTVRITAGSAWNSVSIFPTRPSISVSGRGTNTISFDLPEGKPIVVAAAGKNPLFLSSRSLEVNPPVLGSDSVKSIMDFVTASDTTGSATITAKVQAGIDWVAANYATKPILYLPNGVYKTGTLRMKSHVKMYLQGSACLYGTTLPADYPQAGFTRDGIQGKIFFNPDGAREWKLYGRGIIDPRASEYAGGDPDVHELFSLYLLNTHKGVVDGITLKNSEYWNLCFDYSDSSKFKDISIIHDGMHANGDGCNMVSSNNDTSQGCVQFRTSDDGFNVGVDKTFADGCHDNIFMDGWLWMRGSESNCLRISVCSAGPIYNITWKNMDARGYRNGIVYEPSVWESCDPSIGEIYNIRWENCYVDSMKEAEFKVGGLSNALFHDIDVVDCGWPATGRGSVGTVTNMRFVNTKRGGVCATSAAAAGLTVDGSAKNVAFTCGTTAACDPQPQAQHQRPDLRIVGGAKGSLRAFTLPSSDRPSTVRIYDARGSLIASKRVLPGEKLNVSEITGKSGGVVMMERR